MINYQKFKKYLSKKGVITVFRILVSDAISEEGLAPLLNAEHIEVVQKKVSEVEESLDQFDALLVRSATKVTEELFSKMKSLKNMESLSSMLPTVIPFQQQSIHLP
jgi:phosphoglycerate dehydrogenase-like enzyme